MIPVTAAEITALNGSEVIDYWLDILIEADNKVFVIGTQNMATTGHTPYFDPVGSTKYEIKLLTPPGFSNTQNFLEGNTFRVQKSAIETEDDYLLECLVLDKFTGADCTWGWICEGYEKIKGVGRVVPTSWDDESVEFEFLDFGQILNGKVPTYGWGVERWDRIEDADNNIDPANPYEQLSAVIDGSFKGRWRKGAKNITNIFNYRIRPAGNGYNTADSGNNLDPRFDPGYGG